MFMRFATRYDFENNPFENAELEKKYNSYGINRSDSKDVTEKKFLQFLKDINSGITILKSDGASRLSARFF